MFRKAKVFFTTLRKSLNPRYFTELSEKNIDSALIYFSILIAFSFALAGLFLVPEMFFIKSDIDDGLMGVKKFFIDSDFETVKPVSIPSARPFITLDTTGNETFDTETLLITNTHIQYNLGSRNGTVALKEYDFTSDRKLTSHMVLGVIVFLLPSVFWFYYIAYFIKYVIIIAITSLVGFAFARLMRNAIELKESIVIAIYTATAMVILEISTIAFFLNHFLLIYSPFLGINFSLVALTIYLALYVTGVRLAGNRSLK